MAVSLALVATILFVAVDPARADHTGLAHLCHWDQTTQSYNEIVPSSPGIISGHLSSHPNDVWPMPADGCDSIDEPTTTTTTTTTTTLVLGPENPKYPQEIEKDCPDDDFCHSGTVENDDTQGKLKGFDATSLYIGVFPVSEASLFCGEYPLLSDTVLFDVFHDDEAQPKIIKVTLLGAEGPKSKYNACYAGILPFLQKNGDLAVFENGLWTGLLPKCQTDGGETIHPPPCIRNRKLLEDGVRIVILAPPGDPRVRIG